MECTSHRLVADVAVLANDAVLMVRYRDTDPYDRQEGWFLPDDFLGFGEDPAGAPARITTEQAGFALPDARLSHVESFTGGPSGAWHLVFHYAARLSERPEVVPGSNVREWRWFDLECLPAAKDVAHHGWGLEVLERVLADPS